MIHFVVSSPLILGLDLKNESQMSEVLLIAITMPKIF